MKQPSSIRVGSNKDSRVSSRLEDETGSKSATQICTTPKEGLVKALYHASGQPGGLTNPTPELTTYGGIKLGWIQGVLIPCLLNIWGVMLFLRISWIVAQAGIGLTVVIIFLSGVVCVITTLSLSAICTNGHLKGGGVYYLVSRSLGAELGASVGIIFAFANAVAASMNTIGFCDSLNDLLRSLGVKIIDNSNNDTRIVGTIALLVMCVICAVGMDWATKTQNFLIVVIVLAIANYVIGASIGPQNNDQIAKGFVGISLETAKQNWFVDYRQSEGVTYDFFSIFAMYFPAVTGVQAGANICGDLKNPASAIPKGTFLAIAISLTSYLVMALLAGTGARRDASGDTSNLNYDVLESCKPNCLYGLHNNYQIMQLMSLWPPLIYAGCWAATLSTALTNLLSVPRLIQALGTDRIYPGLIFFSKRYGRHGEPYRGYVLTYLVSLVFLLIADLNKIAPLISNFYLASYALINFCTFHAAYVYPINWRPTFRSFNKWVSLFGFLMCLCIMIVISWMMALITIFIFITLYLMVVYTKPDVSWGSSTEAQQYHHSISIILEISRRVENIKSYNPQVLVLAGKPYNRPALLDIGNLLTKMGSFMIVADIEPNDLSHEDRMSRIHLGEKWLIARKNRAFFVLLNGFSLERGLLALSQSAGLGRLSPNVLLIGFKTKWTTCAHNAIMSYVRIIQLAFEEQLAVAVLRTSKTNQPSLHVATPDPQSSRAMTRQPSTVSMPTQLYTLMHSNSNITLAENSGNIGISILQETVNRSPSITRAATSSRNVSELRHSVLSDYLPLYFDEAKPIDAWWLYNDGGMNILLPYIISRRGFKEKRRFRIFTLARNEDRMNNVQFHMKRLLAKLRIDYDALTILRDITKPPTEATWELFNNIANNFKTDQLTSELLITDTELKGQYAKTCRHLRLRELLLEYSSDASFIVMTLPIPRKGNVSACLYMTWLEVMSVDMPPILFVRGNEKSVIDI